MLFRDLLYAGRVLKKSPIFTITAIVTIALGISASTAIFSVMNAVLLRPLPYKDSDRLVLACADMKKRGVTDWPFSNANFFDLRNGAAAVFEDFAAVSTGSRLLTREDGNPELVRVASVTTNFFQLLGAKVAVGRDFSKADGQPQELPQPNSMNKEAPKRSPTIAVISYEFWHRRYGGDPAIIGHSIPDGPLIVGVLAPGFELLLPPNQKAERAPDIWLAARLTYDNAQRGNVSLRVIGRLKKGVTLERARAEAAAVSSEIRSIDKVHNGAGFHIRIEPMQKYLVEEARPIIYLLMGTVIFLLLIACANVANLLLVRVSLRGRELGIRAALGGNRRRLIAQMLAESLLLSGLGSILGLGWAWLSIHQLLAITPTNLPRRESIAIDPLVLGFTLLVTISAAVVFGLIPALRASRPDLMNVLKASGRAASQGSGQRMRNCVVIAEVALSFVLLIGAGLMVRSFVALQHIDAGYDSHDLLTFQVLGGPTANAQQRAAFMRHIHDRLAAISGVRSVTASSPFPLADRVGPIRWGKESALADLSKFQAADFQLVLPGYFETLHTPLLAGRTFTDADNAPERNGVIIDQFLAAKAFPNESAVGKRILTRLRTPEAEWVEVIGVVGHQRQTSLVEPGREQIYFPDAFLSHGFANRWAIRTTGDPVKYSGSVRSEIARINSHLLITEMQPMASLVKRAQAQTRFSTLLIGMFGVIAALLAGIGLYGVLSTVVQQRTSEIGVRMALGACPINILTHVVGHGVRLSAVGVMVGLVAALGLTRIMTSLLVGVKAIDPITFATTIVLFLVIATVASWVPARRAASLDPSVALREE